MRETATVRKRNNGSATFDVNAYRPPVIARRSPVIARRSPVIAGVVSERSRTTTRNLYIVMRLQVRRDATTAVCCHAGLPDGDGGGEKNMTKYLHNPFFILNTHNVSS